MIGSKIRTVFPFSGIGNAYSDEILHRARLSPAQLTQKLPAEDARRLFQATRAVLIEWTERLRKDAAGRFPEKVTAFRPEARRLPPGAGGRRAAPSAAAPGPQVVHLVHAERAGVAAQRPGQVGLVQKRPAQRSDLRAQRGRGVGAGEALHGIDHVIPPRVGRREQDLASRRCELVEVVQERAGRSHRVEQVQRRHPLELTGGEGRI